MLKIIANKTTQSPYVDSKHLRKVLILGSIKLPDVFFLLFVVVVVDQVHTHIQPKSLPSVL